MPKRLKKHRDLRLTSGPAANDNGRGPRPGAGGADGELRDAYSRAVVGVVEAVSGAVVNIRVGDGARSRSRHGPHPHPGPPPEGEGKRRWPSAEWEGMRRWPSAEGEGNDRGRGGKTGAGSGFVVTPDGYLLTNHHVVQGARELRVGFTDGSSVRGVVVGGDAATDLAVVRAQAAGLAYCAFGDSARLRVIGVAITPPPPSPSP